MPEGPFNEPRLALNRIYTRTGDRGSSRLVGGQSVPKDASRLECFGTIDELNSFLGLAAVSATEHAATASLAAVLLRIQHELFNAGSILATLPEDVHARQPQITMHEVTQLEHDIDNHNAGLAPLRSFVLPGGSVLCAQLHVCRTVCRRAERLAVTLSRAEAVPSEILQYLNRLSDALFVFSRWAIQAVGAEEVLWQPNESASGQST